MTGKAGTSRELCELGEARGDLSGRVSSELSPKEEEATGRLGGNYS